MSENLSKAQQILMWELFAAGGAKLNKDIAPKPEARDRTTLAKRGLVKVSPAGRTKLIELEDRGWRWIADTDPFPIAAGEKRVTSERRLLQSLMRSIKRYTAGEGKQIQDLFRVKGIKDPTDLRPPDANAVEAAIHGAFFEIAGRPARDHVRLSRLRARLAHIEKTRLDETLLAMRQEGRANLTNLDNPRDIEAEKDAALTSGMQTFHALWIEE